MIIKYFIANSFCGGVGLNRDINYVKGLCHLAEFVDLFCSAETCLQDEKQFIRSLLRRCHCFNAGKKCFRPGL